MSKLVKCSVCKENIQKGQNAIQCNHCKNYFHPTCAMKMSNINSKMKCPICKDIWEPIDTHVTNLVGPIFQKKGIKSTKRKSHRRKQTRKTRK